MRRCVKLSLPALPIQELSPNARLHWRDHREAVETQAQLWIAHLQNAGVRDLEPFTGRVRIWFTVCGTGRKTDPSNWAGHGGLKVLLDCLTPPKANKTYGLGLIPGDGCKDMMGYSAEWGGADGEPETSIEIRG